MREEAKWSVIYTKVAIQKKGGDESTEKGSVQDEK